MVDYHTAEDVIRADGGAPETVTSHRRYLSDARFLVGLESENLNLLEEIESALKNPVWFLFLGRKSFVPCVPPHLPPRNHGGQGEPEGSIVKDKTLELALRAFPFKRLCKWEDMPTQPLRVVVESPESCRR